MSSATLRISGSHRSSPSARQLRVAVYGHFGAGNIGNECTLEAFLDNLRRLHVDASVTSICSGPKVAASANGIVAIPIHHPLAEVRPPGNRVARKAWRAFRAGITLLTEPYRWVRGFLLLRRTDMLVVTGGGMLTDAYGLFDWGPYVLFTWALLARLARCKLIFLNVGVGPLHGRPGRMFVRWALSGASFRSYRDDASKRCVARIGVSTDGDPVHPDLAFGFPAARVPSGATPQRPRPVVGIGVMTDAGRYRHPNPDGRVHSAYVSSLARLTIWLLARGYDVRLLVADPSSDTVAKENVVRAIRDRLPDAEERLLYEPAGSVADFLSQLATVDAVVATRFHNVILATLCGKPVISISFHPKCRSLMEAMGLQNYCLDIEGLNAGRLIATFCDLEAHLEDVKATVEAKVAAYRRDLEAEYRALFTADPCPDAGARAAGSNTAPLTRRCRADNPRFSSPRVPDR